MASSSLSKLKSIQSLKPMPLTLKEVAADPALLQRKSGQCCAACGVLLQETITGKRRTRRGEVCSDCYYEQLGEAIDDHPIASARVRRG